jgi:hypothetical protein
LDGIAYKNIGVKRVPINKKSLHTQMNCSYQLHQLRQNNDKKIATTKLTNTLKKVMDTVKTATGTSENQEDVNHSQG